jgi:hypothetical protein
VQNLRLTFRKRAVLHLARLGQWAACVSKWKAYREHRPTDGPPARPCAPKRSGVASVNSDTRATVTLAHALRQAASRPDAAAVVRAWWQWAYRCVRMDQQKERSVLSGDAMVQAGRDRRRHHALALRHALATGVSAIKLLPLSYSHLH